MERDRNRRLNEIISEGRSPLTRDMIELLRRMGTNDLDVPGARVVQLIDALLAAQAQVAEVREMHVSAENYIGCAACNRDRTAENRQVDFDTQPERGGVPTHFVEAPDEEECCYCGCGHQHAPDPTLTHIGGPSCVMCKWCQCHADHTEVTW
jgi:hypothetical protein